MDQRPAAALIRVRGLVQGVGFRPAVWRLAQRHELRGWVRNDGAGVAILLCGAASAIDALAAELCRAPPPLARIDALEQYRRAAAGLCRFPDFAEPG